MRRFSGTPAGAPTYPSVAESYLPSAVASNSLSGGSLGGARKSRSAYSTQPPTGDVWDTPFGEIDVVYSVPRVRPRGSVDSPIVDRLASRVTSAQHSISASQTVLNAKYGREAARGNGLLGSGPTPTQVHAGDAASAAAFHRPVRSMISKAVQTMPESTFKVDAATSTQPGAFTPTKRVTARSQVTTDVISRSQSLLRSYNEDPGSVLLPHPSPAMPGPAPMMSSVTTNTTLSPRIMAMAHTRRRGKTPSKYMLPPGVPSDLVDGEDVLSPSRGLPAAFRTASSVLSSSKTGSAGYVYAHFPPPSRQHDLPFPKMSMTPMVDSRRALSPSSLRRSVDAAAAVQMAESLDAEDAARRLEFSSSSRGGGGVRTRSLADAFAFGAAGVAASATASPAGVRRQAAEIVSAREAAAVVGKDHEIAALYDQIDRLQRDRDELSSITRELALSGRDNHV